MSIGTCDPTRRRAPDARPQQILDAALLVFGEQGLAGARLDDIARRAGLAKGTIYLYFANKEELFREVIRQTIITRLERRAAEFAAADPNIDAEAQLRGYMAEWWTFLCTPAFRTVYRLVVGELPRFPDLFRFYLDEVVTRSNALLGSVLLRGIARGEFRPMDPSSTARMISALLIAHSLWVEQPIMPPISAVGDLTPDAALAQLQDFALHALRPLAAERSGLPA